LQLLCEIVELETAEGLEVAVETPQGRRDLALFLHGGEVRAFINSCPHQGRPLSWRPGAFLFDGDRLVCPHHGAVFELGGGRCLSGPCAGAALRPVAVSTVDGRVLLVEGD
jgi:nitrite reductase/ring-hydroxylating ferredoxin subunit